MDILDYDTGPILCQAAFTADFAVRTDLPIQQLVNIIENERASMDLHRGMRHTYTPALRSRHRRPPSRRSLPLRQVGQRR